MAHKTLIGGTAYDITGGKCLVGGTGYSIQKGRTLVGGTGYDISFQSGVELGTLAEGTLVKLNESGSPVEFYVACHDYESGLNGSGRTLLVRKDCYDERQFNSTAKYDSYKNSDIQEWLESTYRKLLDSDVQTAIGTTKIYYAFNSESTSASTRAFYVFLLSTVELGFSSSRYTLPVGTKLPIASTLYKVKYNGAYCSQWTRSLVYADEDSQSVCIIDDDWELSYASKTSSFGSRPAFTLPSTALFDPDTLEFVSA